MERLKRIAIIGDVHACDRRLELLLSHLRAEELDLVACVGDIVDGPGDPDASAALLRSHRVATRSRSPAARTSYSVMACSTTT